MIITPHTPVEYSEPHNYGCKGIPYTSATQIVDKFREEFKARERAEAYAAKNGGTPEYWLAVWKEKNRKSLVRGNKIHTANEVALHGRMIDVVDGKVLPVHGELYPDTYPWIERPDGVYTERMLWHHGYKIAGRADKVILETGCDHIRTIPAGVALQSRIAHIEDYKTNEKLTKVSYQFKNGNYKMMKPPIAHLMDCNWIHYTLQLSLYMFMLEYQGFRPGTMKLKWYPHDGDPVYESVEYMKRGVIQMLNYLNRAA